MNSEAEPDNIIPFREVRREILRAIMDVPFPSQKSQAKEWERNRQQARHELARMSEEDRLAKFGIIEGGKA